MSIDKLKRIMWRLREGTGNISTQQLYLLKEVRKAIGYEIGLDERTMKKYIDLLIEMGQLNRLNRWYFKDIAGVI